MINRLCNNPDLFTIVMPIKDRPEFLRRSLNFLATQGFLGRVVIADGSNEDMNLENKQIVDSQQEIQIVYVHTADVSGNMGWWIEMYQALKDKECKYSLLYPDDDFFFLDEVDHCLDFLENNQDYVSARGRFVWIDQSYNNNGEIGQISASDQTVFSSMPMYSFTMSVVEHRITDMFSHYCHGFYDIVRRDIFLNVLNQIPKYFSKSAWLEQFACTILCGIHGKTHTSPQLYCIRQHHPDQGQAREARANPYRSWPMLLISPDFSDTYHSFRQCLIDNCREFVSIDDEELKLIIDRGLVALVKRGFGVGLPPLEIQDSELLSRLKDSNSIDYQRMLQTLPFLATVSSEQ